MHDTLAPVNSDWNPLSTDAFMAIGAHAPVAPLAAPD
jgi:hypothetical protein